MWFRQDLRLSDHPALTAAASAGDIIPLFILDDASPGDWRWGGASRWWLHRSLEVLGKTVPLVLRQGPAVQVLRDVVAETNASHLHFTRDYAPWAGALEAGVKALCDESGVACHRHGGFLLHEPENIRNGSGTYFKVYTPFSRACFATGEPRPAKPAPKIAWAKQQLKSDALNDWGLVPSNPDWAAQMQNVWQPGEAGAQARLAEFLEEGLAGYADGRDRPDSGNTSRLSPHLHWGEISPHQVWQGLRHAMARAEGRLDRDGEKFLKEMLWREFSHHLLHHNPTLPTQPFKPAFAGFPWLTDPVGLRHWQRGQTGYPIVDAGMRELWATGIMHNRVRMIVASFLVKDLLISWTQGARWFWDTLVDADIANNSASWQWVSGCGADASPYFRIFNPLLQGGKFDPEGSYVRRWVPELRDVPDDFIHHPWDMTVPPAFYAKPIVNHGLARNRAMAALREIKTGDAS